MDWKLYGGAAVGIFIGAIVMGIVLNAVGQKV